MTKNIFLLLLLPLAGCITVPQYVAMDSSTKDNLKTIKVVTAVQQDEIIVVAENPGASAAMGGGLIGALIDSHIAKGRQVELQATIDPLYAAIDDVDFRKELWASLAPQLQALYPERITEIKTTAVVMTRNQKDELVAKLPAGSALMYLSTSYSFTPDFSALKVATSVDLWASNSKDKENKPVYSNVFFYLSAPVRGGMAINAWAKDGGKEYRAAVRESIAETLKMLQLDLKYPRINQVDQGLAAGTKSLSIRPASTPQFLISGPALDDQPTRVVLRNTDGRLYSITR
jgi:hypothetical protein